MFRTFLARRYLLTRRINLLSIAGVAVGVSALIVVLSVMNGFIEETKRRARGTLADLIVAPMASDDDARLDDAGWLETIEGVDGVVAASPQLNWFAILRTPGAAGRQMMANSRMADINGVLVKGVDFALEARATDLAEALGREPTADTLGGHDSRVLDAAAPFAAPLERLPELERFAPRPTVIVGERLYSSLWMRPAQTIELLTGTSGGGHGGLRQVNRRFTVAGTFRTGEYEFDLDKVYMDRATMHTELMGGDGAAFTEIAVRVEPDSDLRVMQLRVQGALADADLAAAVDTWEDRKQVYLQAVDWERRMMAVILFLIVLVAGFNIFASLSMMVTEKVRDAGVLAALGATRRGVGSVFLSVGIWTGAVGTALGGALGLLIAHNVDVIEDFLSQRLGIEIFKAELYVFDHLPSEVDGGGVAVILASTLAATVLFSWWPARRAARLDPVAALRYE